MTPWYYPRRFGGGCLRVFCGGTCLAVRSAVGSPGLLWRAMSQRFTRRTVAEPSSAANLSTLDEVDACLHVPLRPSALPIRFIVDSAFLRSSADYLCGIPKGNRAAPDVERFHYIAGAKLGARTYVLQHLVAVKYAEQSAVFLRVADGSNFRALEQIDRWGLTLVGHAHLHVARGADATHPSGTDRDFQARLEQGGHIAVGAVFAPDGHVRFFAGDDSRFDIVVIGKQIEEVDKNVFRIEMANGSFPVAGHCRVLSG